MIVLIMQNFEGDKNFGKKKKVHVPTSMSVSTGLVINMKSRHVIEPDALLKH